MTALETSFSQTFQETLLETYADQFVNLAPEGFVIATIDGDIDKMCRCALELRNILDTMDVDVRLEPVTEGLSCNNSDSFQVRVVPHITEAI